MFEWLSFKLTPFSINEDLDACLVLGNQNMDTLFPLLLKIDFIQRLMVCTEMFWFDLLYVINKLSQNVPVKGAVVSK